MEPSSAEDGTNSAFFRVSAFGLRVYFPVVRKLLLCPPDHYGIEYEINPWMDVARNAVPELAKTQWQRLRDKLRDLGCDVEIVPPQPKLPDMVFTANAGLVVGRKFIRSNFHFPQRQGEERHFEDWFAGRGYELERLPEKLFFEGEGDALFCGETLFCGYKFRSDIRAHQRLGEILKCLVISVELVMDRHYHLDTCFCPLPDGSAIWFPAAFDEYGQRVIRHHAPNAIDVSPEEAARFACNAVVLGQDIVLPNGCPKLCEALTKRGYRPHPLEMSEFLKAGGACKCLVLLLPQREEVDSG
jgi:N-dimethylarginine dimethylaminohydrolase